MRQIYVPRRFQGNSRAIIERANVIIAEYQDQGFRLTLRQLYYQFVARDLFANAGKNYKLLGRMMVWAREAGEADCYVMEDRTREEHTFNAWLNPREFVEDISRYYAEDWWADQEYRPVVWIEKDALIGVIENICTEFRVPYFSTRGNNGQIPMRDAAIKMVDRAEEGHTPVVLYLGDHDPTGIRMTRDVARRLELYGGQPIEVRRVALNMSQVRRHRPPPNPVKESDANTAAYRREFGTSQCWELDALSPTVITALIRSEVEGMIDEKAWASAKRREARHRGGLKRMVNGRLR